MRWVLHDVWKDRGALIFMGQAVLENGCVHTVKCNNTECYHLRIFLLICFGEVSTENYEFLILDTECLKYL
jgi:hypothetical protein